MKKIIVLTVVAFMSLLPYLSLAAEHGQELKLKVDNSKELEETMRWLKGKLNDRRDFLMPAELEYYSKFDYEGCNIKMNFNRTNSTNTFNTYNEYLIDLKDISLVELQHNEYYPTDYSVVIHTFNSSKNIKLKATTEATALEVSKYNPDKPTINPSPAKREIKTENSATDTAYIYLTDLNLAERLVKAFTYAAKLCGGAKEEKF